MRIIRLDITDSTNTYVKNRLKEEGLPDGETLLVTAEGQTAGRGRLGRSFSSKKGSGLYMTVAFPVGKRPEESLMITAAAAVAVLEVLEENGSGKLMIKWVNDLYQNEKKVCGILTEAVTDADTNIMKYVIVGAGINIDADMSQLPSVAGTLRGLSVSKDELSIILAERIAVLGTMAVSSAEGKQKVLSAYRKKSMMTGRDVFWEEDGVNVTGHAEGIDDECRLIVDTKEGKRVLDSGFVSVKPLQ